MILYFPTDLPTYLVGNDYDDHVSEPMMIRLKINIDYLWRHEGILKGVWLITAFMTLNG